MSSLSAIEPPKPIVFVSRGQPDIKLVVFDQEFHVHSAVLKLHSEFFYKFLDSPDKEYLPKIDSKFKYEWVTKVNRDGKGWMLTAAGPKVGNLNHNRFVGNCVPEISVFTKFLHALYDLPYNFEDYKQIIQLNDYAGLYLARSRISRSLSAAIRRTPNIGSSLLCPIDDEYEEEDDTKDLMLQAIIDLRHEELFRTFFTILSGPHPPSTRWKFDICTTPDLKDLAIQIHERLDRKIDAVQRALLEDSMKHFASGSNSSKKFMNKVWDEWKNAAREHGREAPFFRLLHKKLSAIDPEYLPFFDYSMTSIKLKLADLLSCTLPFLREEITGEEEYSFSDYFLCDVLTNEDMPWDSSTEF